MKTKTSAYRLQYIDWVRGLGAAIMLQGHVFDSFLRSDLRLSECFMDPLVVLDFRPLPSVAVLCKLPAARNRAR